MKKSEKNFLKKNSVKKFFRIKNQSGPAKKIKKKYPPYVVGDIFFYFFSRKKQEEKARKKFLKKSVKIFFEIFLHQKSGKICKIQRPRAKGIFVIFWKS